MRSASRSSRGFDDEDYQVMPWSSTPPPVASSSSSKESSSKICDSNVYFPFLYFFSLISLSAIKGGQAMAIRSRLPFFRRLSTAAFTAGLLFWSHAREETAESSSTVQILSWGRGSSGQLGGGKEEIQQVFIKKKTIMCGSPSSPNRS